MWQRGIWLKRKIWNQGQELSQFLQHEAIRSNGNPPGQNTGLWQITSVPSISSFSGKIPVHGISRVSATHVSFFSLDAKMFSLCRDYCAMVTSWTFKRTDLVLLISGPARHLLINGKFFYLDKCHPASCTQIHHLLHFYPVPQCKSRRVGNPLAEQASRDPRETAYNGRTRTHCLKLPLRCHAAQAPRK